jgi:hypothetical protein
MLGHQPLELRDRARMEAVRKITIDPILESGQSELVETSDLALCEVVVRKVGKWPPSKERERRAE